MKTLYITILDKKASYQARGGDIVCGNSDYRIEFIFDSEWGAYDKKTARFIWGGKYIDVEIEENVCTVPIINNAKSVRVGVYAGDLCTTTPAEILCVPSILCGGASPSGDMDAPFASEAQQSAERAKTASESAEIAAQHAENSAISAQTAAESAESAKEAAETAASTVQEVADSINGVDFSEYVKNTDYATDKIAGVVKPIADKGIYSNAVDGSLNLVVASKGDIVNKKHAFKPVVPKYLDYAVKVGITTNTEALTDGEKNNALTWLGVNEALDRRDEQIKALYEHAYGTVPHSPYIDDTTAYEKVVPDSALPYAEVDVATSQTVQRVKHDGNLVSFANEEKNGLTLVNYSDGVIGITGYATANTVFSAPFIFAGGTTYYVHLEYEGGNIPIYTVINGTSLQVPCSSSDYMFNMQDAIRTIRTVKCDEGDYGENPQGSLQIAFATGEEINLIIRPVVNTELETVNTTARAVVTYTSERKQINAYELDAEFDGYVEVEPNGFITFINDESLPIDSTVTYIKRG